MKVVLFCGGLGMRIRDYSDTIPKPMINIGYRPILWHIMKYYAYYGHRDFILCLGFGADIVKHYFLNYDECVSNNFALSQGGKNITLFNSDIYDWKITFADTGTNSNIGQRLKAVENLLEDDEFFLANYSDGLTDFNLNDHINHFIHENEVGSFLCVKPNLTCHFISLSPSGHVEEISDIHHSDIRINGGYFIFRRDIFQYIRDGEELLNEPFQRLVQKRVVMAYKYDGFWACMDTFKDKQLLDDLYARGNAPWEVWKSLPEKRMQKTRNGRVRSC
jgi:glucose-1-phosphate cytidylyltransferase